MIWDIWTKGQPDRRRNRAAERARRRARRRSLPFLEAMEDRVVLSTVSDAGTSTLTIYLADNETLGISSQGSTYDINLYNGGSPTGTFSNGGVSNGGDFSGFGTADLTVNASGVARYTKIVISDANTSAGSTGTNVDLDNSGTNSFQASLDLELLNTPYPQAVQIQTTSFSGSAGLTVNATGGIQDFSSITTAGGSVALNGNIGGAYKGGTMTGVEVDGPISTGAGSITITGTGGANNNYGDTGVYIGAPLTTTSGAVTLTGTSGTYSGPGDIGVSVVNGGLVTTASGPINIQGTVQPGSGGNGVAMYNVANSNPDGVTSATGNISITGSGASTGPCVGIGSAATVTSTGTGGSAATITINGSSSASDGVRISDPGTAVSTVDGNVSITGSSDHPNGYEGVIAYNNAAITTTGAGSVTIKGTGTSGALGVTIAQGALVSSSGTGPVDITGTSAGNLGVYLSDSGTKLTTGAANLTVTGSSAGAYSGDYAVLLQNGVLLSTTGAGSLTINATGTNSAHGFVDYGGAIVSSTGTGPVGITGSSVAEDGVYISDSGTQITTGAANLTISGTTNTTNSTFAGVRVHSSAVVGSTGAGTVSVNGYGTGTGATYGVLAYNNASFTATGAGALSFNGTSDGLDGVDLGNPDVTVSAAAGGVSITGSTNDTTGTYSGVHLGGGLPVTTTGAGPITVKGTAYNTANGVLINGGATLKPQGTGSVSVTGSANTGDGIIISDSGTQVMTAGGGVTLTGSTNQTTPSYSGTLIESGAVVSDTAAGTVTVAGTAPSASTANGVAVDGATVQTGTGALQFQVGGTMTTDASSTISSGGNLTVGAANTNPVNVTILGTFNDTGTPGSVTVTVGGDSNGNNITFEPASTDAATVLLGGAGNDTYTVAPSNIGPGSVTVSDGTTGGTDTLTVQGTPANDTIVVNPTSVTVNGGGVGFAAGNLSTVNVNGLAGNDSFSVTPSKTIVFNVDGGAPTTTPGDSIAAFSPPGQKTVRVTTAAGAGYFQTTGGYQKVNYTSIESVAPVNNAVQVFDNKSSTLAIALGAGQTVAVTSLGSSYQFTLSGGGTFTNAGVTTPGQFTGFGTTTLTVPATGSGYTAIKLFDTGSNDSVDFVSSGANAYATTFLVSLASNTSQSSVQVNQSTFTGTAGLYVSTVGGVQVLSGTLSSASGAIVLTGNVRKNTTGDLIGVDVEAPITSASGAISLRGTSGTGNSYTANEGVLIENSGFVSSTSGAVNISGSAQNGGVYAGVYISGASAGVSTVNGNVAISGNGAPYAYGIYVTSGATISSTGTGTLTLTGTGQYSLGLYVSGGNVTSTGAAINLTGHATDGGGLQIDSSSAVTSTGAAPITLAGTDTGNYGADGVYVDNSTISTAGRLVLQGTASSYDGVSVSDKANVTSSKILIVSGTSSSNGAGVRVDYGATLSTTGTAPLSVSATNNGGGQGLRVGNHGGTLQTANGTLSVTGTASGADGVDVDSNALITSTGSGVVSVSSSGSPLAVNGGTISSATGAVGLTAFGTFASGQDITLTNGGVVSSAGSTATLRARNNVLIDATSTLSAAAKSFTIQAAYGNTSTGPGSQVSILGNLKGATTGYIYAGPGDDTFTINPATSTNIIVEGSGGNDTFNVTPSLTAVITIVGGNGQAGSGSPGDNIVFMTPAGQTHALHITGTGTGFYATTGGYKNVQFIEIASETP